MQADEKCWNPCSQAIADEGVKSTRETRVPSGRHPAKELPDFFDCILPTRWGMRFTHPSRRFTYSEANDQRREDPWKSDDIKGRTPTVIVVNPAADKKADADADVNT